MGEVHGEDVGAAEVRAQEEWAVVRDGSDGGGGAGKGIIAEEFSEVALDGG